MADTQQTHIIKALTPTINQRWPYSCVSAAGYFNDEH